MGVTRKGSGFTLQVLVTTLRRSYCGLSTAITNASLLLFKIFKPHG